MSRTLPSLTAAPATTALVSAVLPVYADTSPAASGPPTTAPAGEVPVLPPLPTVPGLPIPSLPSDALVPGSAGAPAPRRPLAHPPMPRSPALSPHGTSSMHHDAHAPAPASAAYQVSGPLGRDLQVTSASYGGTAYVATLTGLVRLADGA